MGYNRQPRMVVGLITALMIPRWRVQARAVPTGRIPDEPPKGPLPDQDLVSAQCSSYSSWYDRVLRPFPLPA
jgi:hypothetical protein